ncbi:MAG: hypothetical protein ACM3UZ_10020 [Acidobacteriota bacterium]
MPCIVADILLDVSNWEVVSHKELREKHGLNRRTHFWAGLGKEDRLYTLYLLQETARAQEIGKIKYEIKNNAAATSLNRAIVFVPNRRTMDIFGVESLGLKELLLLPVNAAAILNTYNEPPVQNQIKSIIGPANQCKYMFAHYEDDEYYYTDLTLNDLVKRYHLEAYFGSLHKPKKVKIICLPGNVPFYKMEYPEADIVSVPLDLFLAPHEAGDVSV